MKNYFASNTKAYQRPKGLQTLSVFIFASVYFASQSAVRAEDAPAKYQDLVARLPATATYAPSPPSLKGSPRGGDEAGGVEPVETPVTPNRCRA
jgi:hypothetical protein